MPSDAPAPRPTTLRLSLDDGERRLLLRPLADGRLVWAIEGGSEPTQWHLLEAAEVVALAGWLLETVAPSWRRTLARERSRLGDLPAPDTLWAALPASLQCRALVGLLVQLGPELRDVRVRALNETEDPVEEQRLRDAINEAAQAFAQAFAAAASICPGEADGPQGRRRVGRPAPT